MDALTKEVILLKKALADQEVDLREERAEHKVVLLAKDALFAEQSAALKEKDARVQELTDKLFGVMGARCASF